MCVNYFRAARSGPADEAESGGTSLPAAGAHPREVVQERGILEDKSKVRQGWKAGMEQWETAGSLSSMSFCIHIQKLMESGFMELHSAPSLRVNPM